MESSHYMYMRANSSDQTAKKPTVFEETRYGMSSELYATVFCAPFGSIIQFLIKYSNDLPINDLLIYIKGTVS